MGLFQRHPIPGLLRVKLVPFRSAGVCPRALSPDALNVCPSERVQEDLQLQGEGAQHSLALGMGWQHPWSWGPSNPALPFASAAHGEAQ